jgi:hypothetical protein
MTLGVSFSNDTDEFLRGSGTSLYRELGQVALSFNLRDPGWIQKLGISLASSTWNFESRNGRDADFIEGNLDFLEPLQEKYLDQLEADQSRFARLHNQVPEGDYGQDFGRAVENQDESFSEILKGHRFQLFRDSFISFPPVRQRSRSVKEILLRRLFHFVSATTDYQLGQIAHIGPLRQLQARIKHEGGVLEQNEFLDSRERILESNARTDDIVSTWLLKLTNGRYSFKRLNYHAPEVNFLGGLKTNLVIDLETNTPVTFLDVGVGLSQVLPILEELANLQAPGRKSKCLLVEQPELHLHPGMQADLGELMVDILQGSRTNNQIICETHSEAMALRLASLCRRGRLSEDQLKVLFVQQGSSGASVIDISPTSENDFQVEFPLSFSKLRLADLV